MSIVKKICEPPKKFLQSKFNLSLVIVLIIIGIALLVPMPQQQAVPANGFVVDFFYLPACPHCAEEKPILQQLAAEMPDVTFVWHDASATQGSQLFYRRAAEVGLDTKQLKVPTLITPNKSLVGFHTKEEIKNFIEECKKECIEGTPQDTPAQQVTEGFTDFELPFFGRVDLTSFSLPMLAIVLGLIDGFNPCAMWVLIYLIAVLAEVNDRKKTWLIVGSFLLASGTLYFLFMTAWLNVFILVGYLKPIMVAIGLVALGGGLLNLKDGLETKKEIGCKVEGEEDKEKTISKINKIIAQPISIAIILAIIALAFAVNSVEFVCSSAIPAVFTQVLALSNLSGLSYYGYILLYDIFFMLDDIIIFSLAAFAVNTGFMHKYARYSKIIGGIILIALGILLLFAPGLLR